MNSADRPHSAQAISRPSRAEFRKALSASRRWMGWTALGLVVGLIAGLAALCLASDVIDVHVPLESPWRPFLPSLALLPSTIGFFWLMISVDRNPRLKCASCRHSLGLGMEPYKAAVTGRCPKCAQSLFSDSPVERRVRNEESPTTQSLLDRTELKDSANKALRASIWPTLAWAISGGLLLVLGGASRSWATAALPTRLGEMWTPFISNLLLFPGIAIGFWSLAVWARCLNRAMSSCPNCHDDFGHAMLTGNCSSCGRPAVHDPFPGMEPAPESLMAPHARWTITEFLAESKYRRERLWIGCLVGGGLALMWLTPFMFFFNAQGRSRVSNVGMVAFCVCTFGMAAFQCLGVLAWHHFSARHLRCPECRNELLHFSPLVVSSHRCYHCGCVVLKDE